ncbi:hypothetical protein D3C81_1292650 [compost metagenome]
MRTADVQRQRVEELCVDPTDALALKPSRQNAGQSMRALGDALQTFRAVIDRVETGNVGQQDLCGTDVRIGLLTTNMLFAGLQRHAQCDVTPSVLRHADDPPGNRPFVFLAASKECCVRPAVSHRHAESLGGTEHYIGTQLARRRQQQQTQ